MYRYDVESDNLPRGIKTSVPSIYYFPANRKQPPFMEFSGELSPENLLYFIQENADKKFKL
jgi:hypothetical protein